MYLRRVRQRVVLPVNAAIDHLRIHSGAADVLADFVEDQDVQIHRNLAHPRFHQRQHFFFALLHRLSDRYGVDWPVL